MCKLLSFTIILFFYSHVFSQGTPVHISNIGIYDFIDEMASEGHIEIYSVTKPYTRNFIYQKLNILQNNFDKLNKRQQGELERFLDYYKFGNNLATLPEKNTFNLFPKNPKWETSLQHASVFYSDSNFLFATRPILGVQYTTNANGSNLHTIGGAEFFASIGKHFSFYGDLRDNLSEKALVQPSYLTSEPGGSYKTNVQGNEGIDYSEARGGIMLHWQSGEVGLVKDHIVWGDNYRGALIQSGRTPSFTQLKLHLNPARWIDFHFFHAWLVSDVIDSTRSYMLPSGQYRNIPANKYMASNLFTIAPFKNFNFSFGNSIIYSDVNVNPAYFIPFYFYKSVDHTVSTVGINQNSQMFFNISSRLIKHTHMHASLFVDEFSVSRIGKTEHNFYAFKVGNKLNNWPIPNSYLEVEYTKSIPPVYKHYIETITYASNSYNMGYYLNDNAHELHVKLGLKPLKNLNLSYRFNYAQHGNEYDYEVGLTGPQLPVLKDIVWSKQEHQFLLLYEFLTNTYLQLSYTLSNISGANADGLTAQDYLDLYTHEMFHGKTSTIFFGLNLGF